MATKEVPGTYILKEETNALGDQLLRDGTTTSITNEENASQTATHATVSETFSQLKAAQIMLGLIHSALGILWLSLYRLEEKKHSIGLKLMLTSICYLFASGTLRVLAIITNTLSIFVALFGLMLFGYEFPLFESIGINYIWSNMAGMMLLQICVVCTIAELITAIIVLHWFITAKMIVMASRESPAHSELPPPPPPLKPPSVLELEHVSEESHPNQIEDEKNQIEDEKNQIEDEKNQIEDEED